MCSVSQNVEEKEKQERRLAGQDSTDMPFIRQAAEPAIYIIFCLSALMSRLSHVAEQVMPREKRSALVRSHALQHSIIHTHLDTWSPQRS